MTTREAILGALADLVRRALNLPDVPVDEPEPSLWSPRDEPRDGFMTVLVAAAVQDATPESLAFVRGADEAEASEELEFTPVIAIAVQVRPGAGDDIRACRLARRAARDSAIRAVADAITADRTLGLDAEVHAEVQAPARDDEVAFSSVLPAATGLIPVRTLYTGVDAAA